MKLLFKITTLILIVLIAILSIFAYYQIKDEKRVLSSFVNKQGNLLANTISAGTVETILIEDYPLLDSYLMNISKSFDSIVYIKIFKDDVLISKSINQNLLKDSNIVFFHDITIGDNLIAKLELALSTKENELILQERIGTSLKNIFIISLILFLVLMFIVKKYLLERIEKIKNHSMIIAKGIYNKNLEMNTADEFEDLAININIMSQNIDKSNREAKELNSKLEIQKKELITANKAKDMFLANMSHELKTPLNSINVISSIMKRNKQNNLDEKQLQNINIINICGQNLLHLINDVLDISKLEAGEIKLKYETYDLIKSMKDILLIIEPQAKEKNIKLISEFDIDKNIIYSDDLRVKQIIKNFLSNALKFVNNGNITLITKDETDYVSITVSDDGIGIEKDKLAYIFDRFKQVDGSTTRKHGGSGLGLAICKELSKMLNAEISVQSTPNIGSSFTLKIPKNLNMIKQTVIDIPIDKESNNKKALLYSEDIINMMPLAIALKKKFDLKQIHKSKNLINELKTNHFDLIVMDSDNIVLEDLKILESKIIILSNEDKIINDNIKYVNIKKPFNIEEINKILISS